MPIQFPVIRADARGHLSLLPVLLFCIMGVTFTHCSKDSDPIHPPDTDNGTYTLCATYDSIRSHPSGGGVFVVYIRPSSTFTGAVQLTIEADPVLHASLSKRSLIKTDTVTDIIVRPDMEAAIGDYRIVCTTTHGGVEKKRTLTVRVVDWPGGVDTMTYAKRDGFKSWLLARDPQYGEIFSTPMVAFETYPEILIVEHATLLTPRYEFRLCYHVMVPPYDWAKILVRDRRRPEATLAAIMETTGNIREIPLSEYPRFFGY